MADKWVGNLRDGDILRDVHSGEFILLTNGICELSHADPVKYLEAHTDGCRFVPSEGLVFGGDSDHLETWQLKGIAGRALVLADGVDTLKVREFYTRRCEEISKEIRRGRRR
jgi:hypothetical protein